MREWTNPREKPGIAPTLYTFEADPVKHIARSKLGGKAIKHARLEQAIRKKEAQGESWAQRRLGNA